MFSKRELISKKIPIKYKELRSRDNSNFNKDIEEQLLEIFENMELFLLGKLQNLNSTLNSRPASFGR